MSSYTAPVRDMRFVIGELVDLDAIAALPGCEDVGPDLVEAVLEEAGKLAGNVLDPLNQQADRNGARWTEAGVVAAPGFAEAYQQFIEGGWNGLACPTEYDG